MSPFNFLLFSSLLISVPLATVAEIIPLVGRSPAVATHFRRQQPEGGFGNGSVAVFNKGNLQYSCNITLSGREYNVIVDTGSNDLWVSGAPLNSQPTTLSATLGYAGGTVSGSISTAEAAFDTFKIVDQAFLVASKSSGANMPDGNGMLGIGPSNSSTILEKMNGTQEGLPLMDRIFRQNMNTPNYITLMLSRDTDDTVLTVPLLDNHPGLLTIGEPVPQYEEILNMPKLKVPIDPLGQQHWQTLLDSNGIIGPDGKAIQTNTNVSAPGDGKPDQLRVVLDSGFSIPQLPGHVFDAIYGGIPGAKFIPSEDLYSIPCDYELNVTFMLGGKEYPIPPLDLSIKATLDDGTRGCFSHFQKAPADIKRFGSIDAILGMAFLRNAYMLINFGDFVGGSDANVAEPYIQLMSTVNKTAAHLDFVNARLGGKDTTGSQRPLTGSTPQTPPGNGNENTNGNGSNNRNSGKNSAMRSSGGLVGEWWFALCVVFGIVVVI